MKLKLAVALILICACGSSPTSDDLSTTADLDSSTTTSSLSATSTTEIATSTTEVVTSTTEVATTAAPDPVASLTAAFGDRKLVPPLPSVAPTIQEYAEKICGADASAVLPEAGKYFEHVATVDLSVYDETYETVALIVEYVCPEYAELLAFSADQYFEGRTTEWAIGDCFSGPDTGRYGSPMIPVDCAEPHDGEVVALVDAGDSAFPGINERSAFYQGIDCRGPASEYLGPGGFNLAPTLATMADNQADWDSGEKRVVCGSHVHARILVGSLRGQASAVDSAWQSIQFEVEVCEPLRFVGRVTNSGTTDLAVGVLLSAYYPNHRFTVPLVKAGETVEIARTFQEASANFAPECSAIYTGVPTALS